ncbi:MAG: hypothetical protein JWO11_852 [Nocardioides sp.]|nr:hypothetical protein [Nocardioides sp.]
MDCADPRRRAAFWALALGHLEAPPPTGEEWADAGLDHVVGQDPEGNEFCVV